MSYRYACSFSPTKALKLTVSIHTETLRKLDAFLPRITLGKAAPAAVPISQVKERARELHGAHASGDNAPGSPRGFAYLKRDLVRLLGILAADRKAVQDRVRACGGVQAVMNLCVIDERNPCECLGSFLLASMRLSR